MAVGLSPVQLLVLSGLLQDRGLRLPTALTDRLNRLKDTSTLTGRLAYIAWHPQSNASMTSIRDAMRQQVPGLAAVVPSTYTRTLPEGLRIFDVAGTIKTRADNLLGNGLKGLLENLSICAGELQKSFDVQASLDTYKNAKFSDIYLNASNYTDVISHGLTASFGSTATGTPAAQQAKETRRTVTTKEIQKELTSLNTAIKQLGQLFDWTDLNTVGSPDAFVKNIYKIGAAYNTEINNLMSFYGYSVETIGARDSIGLTQMLQRITGKDIGMILKASGAVVPNISAIDSAADFLEASKILPSEVSKMLPNGDLKQLGKKLASLGVNSSNINSILGALSQVEIVDLPKLNQLTVPIPAADASVIQNTLISGLGQFKNATLDDLLGVLTGNNYNAAMDDIVAASKFFLDRSSGLFEAAGAIVTTLSSGGTVNSTQATSFVTAATALRTAINTARASITKAPSATPTLNELIWNNYDRAERAVITIIDRLRQEIVNGEIIGLRITSNIIVSTANTTIDTFDIRNIRKAVYKIGVQNDTKFDDFEAKVIHNGTIANVLVYNRSLLGTNVSLGNVFATVNVSANTCSISYATASDNNFHTFLRPTVEYTPIHDGSDPLSLQGSSAEINAVYQLDEIAADVQFTGIGTLLESMANNDVYGEAILASLVTSRNSRKLQAIGINGKRADPLERLTEVLAKQGRGLTESQRRAILLTAEADKTDANLAIAMASRHGFFSDFYSKKGNFG